MPLTPWAASSYTHVESLLRPSHERPVRQERRCRQALSFGMRLSLPLRLLWRRRRARLKSRRFPSLFLALARGALTTIVGD